MAITLSSTTNFNETVQELIRRELEDELIPNLPYLADQGLFIKATFVKGTNNTMRFLRMPYFTAPTPVAIDTTGPTAPWLKEGAPPTSQAMAFGFQEFVAGQNGQSVGWSDIAAERSPLDLMAQAGKFTARLASENADGYVSLIVNAGTNVLYAGSATSRVTVSATSVITGSLLRRATQTMKGDNIPRFTDGSYRAIIHPDVVFDLEEDTDVGGWLSVSQYNGGVAILSNELGKYAGIRFMESPKAAIFADAGVGGTVDVYSTFISGPASFAFGEWNGTEFFYTAPGGQTDPLHQNYILGYKGNFGATLVDAAGPRYLRIESASALGA